MKTTGLFGMLIVAGLLAAGTVFAHCEIPCGIYDDEQRVAMIAEHVTTIEKSIRMVEELSAAEPVNYNQLVRWVNNKELHANKLQEIVYQYFMNQRIKPVEDAATADYAKYVKELTLLHKMLVEAMKAKQTTDLAHVENLRALLKEFKTSYFGLKEKPADLRREMGMSDHGHEH